MGPLVDNSVSTPVDLTSLGVSLGTLIAGQDFIQKSVDKVDGKVDNLDTKVDGVATTLSAHAVEIERLRGRATALEATANDRKPIHWTAFVGGLGSIVAVLVAAYALIQH